MITDEQYRDLCKDCYRPPIHIALREYANTKEYLRKLCAWFETNSKSSDNEVKKEINESLDRSSVNPVQRQKSDDTLICSYGFCKKQGYRRSIHNGKVLCREHHIERLKQLHSPDKNTNTVNTSGDTFNSDLCKCGHNYGIHFMHPDSGCSKCKCFGFQPKEAK